MFGLCVRGVLGVSGCVVATPAWMSVAITGATIVGIVIVTTKYIDKVETL